jgi:hypothetical protein
MALQKPELIGHGDLLIIRISIGSADTESLFDSLSVVLPFLEVTVRCEEYFATISDDQKILRLRGIVAQHLVSRAKLAQASTAANLLATVIDGRADVADYGFPEFALESQFDV